MLAAQLNKGQELLLRIRRIRVVHGGAAVAQAPLRLKERPAGEANKRLGHLQQRRAQHHVVIQIARLCAVTAIRQMIII